MSNQTVYSHHYQHPAQIHKLARLTAHHGDGCHGAETAWELPNAIDVCELTGRLQDRPESDDHSPPVSDAVVSLGLDQPVPIHDTQRLEERKDVVSQTACPTFVATAPASMAWWGCRAGNEAYLRLRSAFHGTVATCPRRAVEITATEPAKSHCSH